MSIEVRKNKRKQLFNKLLSKGAPSETKNARKSYDDERFWEPSRDKTGNGGAVIRFLPSPNEDEEPFVQYWTHSFKGPTGQWYIEKNLNSIGKNDPVSDYNSKLWNSGLDKNKDKARAQKRNLRYVANIYVEKDPLNPENEGKVFLFRFGKQHMDKIEKLMYPVADELDDETPEPIVPFDPWDGASYKIKVTTRQAGAGRSFPNYEESTFLKSSPLFKGKDADDKIEEVISQGYELNEFIDPANYKSYEELQEKLNRVLGINTTASVVEQAVEAADEKFENTVNETVSSDDPPFDLDDDEDDDVDFDKMLKELSD